MTTVTWKSPRLFFKFYKTKASFSGFDLAPNFSSILKSSFFDLSKKVLKRATQNGHTMFSKAYPSQPRSQAYTEPSWQSEHFCQCAKPHVAAGSRTHDLDVSVLLSNRCVTRLLSRKNAQHVLNKTAETPTVLWNLDCGETFVCRVEYTYCRESTSNKVLRSTL